MNTTGLSKNQITPTKFHSYTNGYEWNEHDSYYTYVWLEDYETILRNGGDDPVAYAKKMGGEGQRVYYPRFARTKWRVWVAETTEGGTNNNHTEQMASPDGFAKTDPTNYNERDVVFREAYYKDRPSVAKMIVEAQRDARRRFAKTTTTATRQKSYEYNHEFIKSCLRTDLTVVQYRRSVLVLLMNKPIYHERFVFSAYLQREGMFVSHPKFVKDAGGNYVVKILINQREQTEECCEFIERDNLADHNSILTGTGRDKVLLYEEGSAVRTDIYRVLNDGGRDKVFPKMMIQKRVQWSIWNGVETIEIVRGGSNALLSDLKKDRYKQGTFQEELVQAVFHPDRVARLVGDNWGTEESWLNQI